MASNWRQRKAGCGRNRAGLASIWIVSVKAIVARVAKMTVLFFFAREVMFLAVDCMLR